MRHDVVCHVLTSSSKPVGQALPASVTQAPTNDGPITPGLLLGRLPTVQCHEASPKRLETKVFGPATAGTGDIWRPAGDLQETPRTFISSDSNACQGTSCQSASTAPGQAKIPTLQAQDPRMWGDGGGGW